ncbi:MAG: FKBP-type peptidyl-prolyl cis-trans isomerase [Actinomycetota bacterium]|nr:FKBP-type peptidyl-prolyl cis-trans isomerase [Actinomycetota bacterium]
MYRRRFLLRAAAPAAAVALLLAGCGDAASPAASGSSSAASADLGSVKVGGAAGAKPVVTVPTPFSVGTTTTRVLTKGTGAAVTEGQRVTLDYSGYNGTDGKEFDSSFGNGKPRSFVLDSKQTLPGLVKGLIGASVGSRLLLAIPPGEAYGTQGQAAAGIGPTDTILILADVKAAKTVLARAAGTPVKPKAGLPAVTLSGTGKPSIKVPSAKAPSALVVQPLIVGQGAKVGKGQQITVHYTGVIWPGGKQFDSSWDKSAPATFAIGTGSVIAGWDEGLVGQPVGSQILLVIPPDKGYGATGQPDAGITGTDTLAFVVDILDAA